MVILKLVSISWVLVTSLENLAGLDTYTRPSISMDVTIWRLNDMMIG